MADISKIKFKGVEYNIKPLMDAEPTAGSTNAVQSGGVYDAIPAIDPTLTQSGQAADSKAVGDEIGELKSALNELDGIVSDNIIHFVPYDRQLFDIDTMIPAEPIKLTINSQLKLVSTSAFRMYIIEINGKSGEQYSFNFVTKDGSAVETLKEVNIFVSNTYPVLDDYVLQDGSVNVASMRGTITLAQDSKYLLINIKLSSPSTYPADPYTEACTTAMGYIVVRKGTYDTAWYSYAEYPIYDIVPYNQGPANYGKILKVNADGLLELADESGGGGDVLTDAVAYYNSHTLTVRENMISPDSSVTLGTGWSGTVSGGFSHSSGTDPLTFNVQTDSNTAYIIEFDYSGQSENSIYISIGGEPLCDVYNGTTHACVGVISDGGYLKITPTSGFTGTITTISLREVAEDGTEITQTVKNVYDVGLSSNLTGFWNVAIGGDSTLKNNQSGSRNIAIGNLALRDLKTGTRNIAIGTFAMPFVTEGERNIAIGADTLYDTKNITSRKVSDNVAIGKAALQSGSEIKQNIAIGSNAMGNSTDTSLGNVAVGYNALYKGANNNVAIGKNANYFGTGSNNTSIGYGSGASNTTPSVSNSIAIGYNVNFNKSNQMVLGGENITEVVLCGNKKIIFGQDGSVTWEKVT